ncbi:hypothetical protein ACVWWK_004143 [Bradyrhizobium sp. LB9.1b]
MAGPALIPAGDFRTSYAADTTIFPTTTSRNFAIVGVVLLCLVPQFLGGYWLSILIQIGIFSIAALGLNILVGFTGQISIGHAAFFLLGAFTSAYISNNASIPVFFAIPLAGVVTALVGLIFGIPAARLKGLYLVIATLGRHNTSCSTSSPARSGSPAARCRRAPTRSRSSDTRCAATGSISMSCSPM